MNINAASGPCPVFSPIPFPPTPCCWAATADGGHDACSVVRQGPQTQILTSGSAVKKWMPQSYSKDFKEVYDLLGGVIDPNKFWPLLSLVMVRPYMSVRSEGFTSAINLLCDESSELVSIRFHVYIILSRVGQQAKSWCSFFQWNKQIWKSHFVFYAMLINCPFVPSLLYCYWTCRQTPPLAGRKKKLPAVHIEVIPFSCVAVQIIGFSFQWLKGNIENTFWFGSSPKGECFFSSLISFHKCSMRHSGVRLFTAFHDLKK